MSADGAMRGLERLTPKGSVPAVDAVSAERLATVVPALASRVERLMWALAWLGIPVRVTQARRTTEEQWSLYQQGRTTPGDTVTDCDGRRKRSKHQDGRAIDLVFKTADRGVTWDGPWELVGLMAEQLGLKWGGRFLRPDGKPKPDRPHLELPDGMGDED